MIENNTPEPCADTNGAMKKTKEETKTGLKSNIKITKKVSEKRTRLMQRII